MTDKIRTRPHSTAQEGSGRGGDFDALCRQAQACTLCAGALPHPPRPVFRVHPEARILVAGQAPGRKVHASGIPWDDASGERLRAWMGVDAGTFYDARRIAIVPMGFCYPGKGASGDLPPRPECAATWRAPMLALLPRIALTLAIGRYAIDWHLGDSRSLTEVVADWRQCLPGVVPLPHPSPRNQLWLRRNPHVEAELLPWLRRRIAELLEAT